MNTMRFVMTFVVMSFTAEIATSQSPVAPPPHLALSELVKEYERYGLPHPPQNAQLVRIDWYRYSDPRPAPIDNPYVLAWRVPSAKPDDRPRYSTIHYRGSGFVEAEYVEPAAVREVRPAPDALRSIDYQNGGYFLSLAVQAKNRGWDELAGALYSLARERFVEEERERLERDKKASTRPEVGRELEELRTIAEVYWHRQITSRSGDRKEAVRRLTALAAEEAPPDPKVAEYLRKLALTVAPRKSKAGSVEALIDDLTEYWDDPLSVLPEPAEPASYWKLAELGFDAVPALIEHVNDDRLTRTWVVGFNNFRPYSVTVGHLCSRLLFDLSARTIGGRYWELRGDRLDPAEAHKWFEKAKKVGEERWLLDHAVPADGGVAIVNQSGRPEPLLVRVIGAKYPARLPAIYREMLKKPVRGTWLNDYVNEIVLSKLTQKEKIALLEEGAVSDDLDHRLFAMKGLAELDQPLLRKHLLATLKQIQLRKLTIKPNQGVEDQLLRLAEAADDGGCWDALASVARTADVASRMQFLWSITPVGPPDRKDPHRLARIRFLTPFLSDVTSDTEWAGAKIEVRDFTATRLAGVLGFSVRRQSDTYIPIHDPDLNPLTRLLLRELMRLIAMRELVAGK